MIGGFEDPSLGTVYLGGRDVTDLPPYRRDVNTVFQSYALFPHLDVFENVAFGLRRKKVGGKDIGQRVRDAMSLVDLEGFEKRKPSQMSGGQQQRVALARALVNRPKVLLLDEPLGALYLKLRKQMQLELKRIQHELKTTFVYVTHDQEEALSMSDRIAVMNAGVVEHLGSPREVYERPATPFVADFVGVLNAAELRVRSVNGEHAVLSLNDRDRFVAPSEGLGLVEGTDVLAAVRPERVTLEKGDTDGAADGSRLSGTVAQVVYLGTLTQFFVDTATGRPFVVHVLSSEGGDVVEAGDAVTLTWPAEDTSILRVGPGD
jgi:spermidine/putrescine transport system ATP-binding protein